MDLEAMHLGKIVKPVIHAEDTFVAAIDAPWAEASPKEGTGSVVWDVTFYLQLNRYPLLICGVKLLRSVTHQLHR